MGDLEKPKVELDNGNFDDDFYKINIKKEGKDFLSLQIKKSDTIGTIKNQIFKTSQIPVSQQILKYNSKAILDNETLPKGLPDDVIDLEFEMVGQVKKENIKIVNVNVVMRTNKGTKLNLTADLFLIDNSEKLKSGQYPFLCTNVKYNENYFEDKPFLEIIQTFFNEKEFEKFVLTSPELSEGHEQENILFMLQKLFPISFPVPDDVQLYSTMNIIDLGKMFNKAWRKTNYVYLNIGGPTTVTQVVWLNTIRSNPEYVKLYGIMKKYKENLIQYVNGKLDKTGSSSERTTPSYSTINKKIFDMISRLFRDQYTRYLTATEFASLKRNNEIAAKNMSKDAILKQISELKRIFENRPVPKSFLEEIKLIESQTTLDDSNDTKKIKMLFSDYQKSFIGDDDLRAELANYKSHGSFWWKLYFILYGLKKNTLTYNTFVEEYVKRFVLQRDENRYSMYSSYSSNENRFYKNLSDLSFYFDFLNKVDDFVKQRRKSTTKSLSEIFEESENSVVIHVDNYLTLFNKDGDAAFDRVQETKSKEKEASEKEEYKTKFYEIQLGIALVGGKIIKVSNKFWCKFEAIKLAKDKEFLDRYDVGDIKLYPYVEYEKGDDNDDAKAPPAKAPPVKAPPVKAPPAKAAPPTKMPFDNDEKLFGNEDYPTLLNLKGGRRRKTRNKRLFKKKKRTMRKY
jgi:hypothetical protein